MKQAHIEEYEELFRREHATIARVAFLVVGDRDLASEVAQDAFVELFVNWRKVRRLDRPGAWVRRVAIRRAVRVRTRESRSTTGVAPIPVVDTSVGLDLDAALGHLSPTQRAAVVLHYYQELPVHEVADALGIKPSTASVHLHRARARLGKLLGEEVSDDVVG